ncbi:MAG: hypothetical protein ACJAV1_003626 [Paraglaciecola sp.]|jgi:hypothetical protein
MQSQFLKNGVPKITPENMKEALQQAIEIEIATLPTYLSTYYSIQRVPQQQSMTDEFTSLFVKAGKTEQVAATQGLELSAKIMVFANKAGANIISVAVEEMLHMSLVSNVKQAMFGNPELTGKSPEIWPAYLAGHEPAFPINRAKLSGKQLTTFMLIESPKPFDKTLFKTGAIPYCTIGDFYQGIKDCITEYYKDDSQYDPGRPQLVPNRGYYAQNNIDSMYYDKQHKPVYQNAEDAGNLIHVVDKNTALQALEIIIEQGEGAGSDNDPDRIYDDPSCKELAHYFKFKQLKEELAEINGLFKATFGEAFEVEKYFIHNFEDNVTTADFPTSIQAVSKLTNAMYSYLFIMSQACYHADEHTQFEIFMFGIHKSMLWILSSLCNTMNTFKYIGKDGQEYVATATYEEYQFSASSSPKSQIIELFNQALGAYEGIDYIKERIHDLPDVSLEDYLKKSDSSLMA